MRRGITCFLLGIVLAGPAMGLTNGEAAPSISITDWIKGGPLQSLDPAKITVLDVWATWCQPCRQQIPHMTAMQHQYQDEVLLLSVSKESPAVVAPFVAAQGDNMDYIVACDTSGWTSYDYGVEVIPTTFIIDQAGILVWSGHPAYADGPLAAAVAARFRWTRQPCGGLVEEGSTHALCTATTGGTGPLTYTWYKDGIQAGTGATLDITPVGANADGTYQCLATDARGVELTSQTATLQVVPENSLPLNGAALMAILTVLLGLLGMRKSLRTLVR